VLPAEAGCASPSGGGRGGEGEKLDDVGVTQCKVGFVRLPIGAIMFGAEGEPEDVGIEL